VAPPMLHCTAPVTSDRVKKNRIPQTGDSQCFTATRNALWRPTPWAYIHNRIEFKISLYNHWRILSNACILRNPSPGGFPDANKH